MIVINWYKKHKKVLFFTSPYSFEGSIINFGKIFEWAINNGYQGIVLADTNLHGAVKFLKIAEKFRENISAYLGYRIEDNVIVFTNEDEVKEFIRLYNLRNYGSEILMKFKNFKITPCCYIPYKKSEGRLLNEQIEVHKFLCSYLGKPSVFATELDCALEVDMENPNYTLETFRSSQRLPKAPDNFIERLYVQEELYKERIEHEIQLIKEFNLEDYFYTMKEIVEVAKKHGIIIGFGRGSAVASLVSYRLAITKIDPMKYDLLFERFLNSARKDFPDIDLDVEDERRQELIEALKKKFGYVYNISTFASIPRKLLESVPENLHVILKNIPVQRSTHASGIIISTMPINAPLAAGTETLEWDMEDLQQLGYTKFDILGLKTLSIFKELTKTVRRHIKRKGGSEVYKIISAGFTDNVFQLDSSLGKAVVRDVSPKSLNELAIAISLNRPGPINSGVTQEIRNLKLKKERKYNIDILSETYGIPIYQEQVMKIAMELAGFSSAEADALRKAITKKDTLEMDELFKRLKKALVNKFGKEGLELSKSIQAFGEYAFNKSHAIAYAYLTYYMAFFKINYTDIFYDIYLKHDTSILKDAIYNLQVLNYEVLPPKIKSFSATAGDDENNKNIKRGRKGQLIYNLPLYVLPGISYEKSVEIQNKKFRNFEDFVENSGLNLSTVEMLIKVGVFDEIFESRRKAIQKLRNIKSGVEPLVNKIGSKLFGKIIQRDDTKVEEDWERTNMEYEILNVALSLPTKVNNKLAPYCLAYSLDLHYATHVCVKAGYVTDGKSVFKYNIPDGYYTLIYPEKFEPGHYQVSYLVQTEIKKSEIIRAKKRDGDEEIILSSGGKILNARPLINTFKTILKKESK